jgi:hypothetical protein
MLAAFFLTPIEIIAGLVTGVTGLLGSLWNTNRKRNQPPKKGKTKKGKKR